MSDGHRAFVPLGALRPRPPDPARVLAEIREIYFRTTRQTIHDDLVHAIELLKTLPTDEDREKARVYMDGLSQMRSEWSRRSPREKGARGQGAKDARGRGGKGARGRGGKG